MIWRKAHRLTCCALHNMLLGDMGEFIQGDSDDWDGEMGRHGEDDARRNLLPHPLSRLYQAPSVRDLRSLQSFDSSHHPREPPVEEEDEEVQSRDFSLEEQHLLDNPSELRVVKNLSHKFFRSRLIENFRIRFERNDVEWPYVKKMPREPHQLV